MEPARPHQRHAPAPPLEPARPSGAERLRGALGLLTVTAAMGIAVAAAIALTLVVLAVLALTLLG